MKLLRNKLLCAAAIAVHVVVETIHRGMRIILPISPHTRGVEGGLVANQPHVFGLRLCDKHPVERIPVGDRELSSKLCVDQRYRQGSEALSEYVGVHGPCSARPLELADPHFGSDLPGRCCAHEYVRCVIGDRLPGLSREARVRRGPPQKRVRVEKKSQEFFPPTPLARLREAARRRHPGS